MYGSTVVGRTNQTYTFELQPFAPVQFTRPYEHMYMYLHVHKKDIYQISK